MYMVNETLLSLTYQWVLQYASAASGTAALCAARTVQYDIRPLLYGHVEKLLFCACGPLGSQLTGSDVRGHHFGCVSPYTVQVAEPSPGPSTAAVLNCQSSTTTSH